MTQCKLSDDAPWPKVELNENYTIYKDKYVDYIESTSGIRAIKQYLEFAQKIEVKEEIIKEKKKRTKVEEIPPLPKE